MKNIRIQDLRKQSRKQKLQNKKKNRAETFWKTLRTWMRAKGNGFKQMVILYEGTYVILNLVFFNVLVFEDS